jgi:hypothetical protein
MEQRFAQNVEHRPIRFDVATQYDERGLFPNLGRDIAHRARERFTRISERAHTDRLHLFEHPPDHPIKDIRICANALGNGVGTSRSTTEILLERVEQWEELGVSCAVVKRLPHFWTDGAPLS